MKVKKLFVTIAVLIAIVLGFTACLGGNGKSSVTITAPAVIGDAGLIVGGGIQLMTAYGNFVPDNASAIELLSLYPGSCIFTQFDYNSEYQTGKYMVASNIKYQPVEISIADDDVADRNLAYNYLFKSVNLLNPLDESISSNYEGRIFVITTARLGKNQELNYFLYYKSGEPLDATGARSIYLQAELPSTPSSSAEDVVEMRALDMRYMFASFGRDTTIQNYPLRYLRIDLKYISSIENEKPDYKSVNPQPFNIYILRKEDL